MFKNFGYYVFFLALILLFGVSGISDALNSKAVYIVSGTVIAVSLSLAVWITVTRRTFRNIESLKPEPKEPKETKTPKSEPAKSKPKAKAKAKVTRKVKK